MYPLKLKPIFKDYIWGGNTLKEKYNKESDLDILAESWELACHNDGMSIIINGEDKDKTLQEYIDAYGKANVLGKNSDKFEYFPLLVKYIDAKNNLSLQVHPDDKFAKEVENSYGKTEMWYVLDCVEGAKLIYGFAKDIDANEFKTRIENNTILDVCNFVNVKKGDVFFIEAGTLHAICEGIVIAEIQQNSNITYRIYDYQRVDANNNPRELHIDKALQVTDLSAVKNSDFTPDLLQKTENFEEYMLSKCEYFEVYKYNIFSKVKFSCDSNSFNSLLITEGEFELEYKDNSLKLCKGDSIFIPASFGEYNLVGNGEIILSKI